MSDTEIKRGILWRQSDKLFARYEGENPPELVLYGLDVLEK